MNSYIRMSSVQSFCTIFEQILHAWGLLSLTSHYKLGEFHPTKISNYYWVVPTLIRMLVTLLTLLGRTKRQNVWMSADFNLGVAGFSISNLRKECCGDKPHKKHQIHRVSYSNKTTKCPNDTLYLCWQFANRQSFELWIFHAQGISIWYNAH